jgi:hypothetical protein
LSTSSASDATLSAIPGIDFQSLVIIRNYAGHLRLSAAAAPGRRFRPYRKLSAIELQIVARPEVSPDEGR